MVISRSGWKKSLNFLIPRMASLIGLLAQWHLCRLAIRSLPLWIIDLSRHRTRSHPGLLGNVFMIIIPPVRSSTSPDLHRVHLLGHLGWGAAYITGLEATNCSACWTHTFHLRRIRFHSPFDPLRTFLQTLLQSPLFSRNKNKRTIT